MPLHPAENRGYRELYLTGRQLVGHWAKLEGRLGGGRAEAALRETAQAVREMLVELEPLTAEQGLHGGIAAQGSGTVLGSARGAVLDRFAERNQAVRLAAGELDHVITLLAYLAAVSEGGGNARLAEFSRAWEQRLSSGASALREAVVELGADPDTAVQPLDASPVGRVAHGAAHAAGTLGEWIDRRTARS